MEMQFDEFGREIPDPVPLSVPLGTQRPESLTDMMRRMIRNEFSKEAEAAGQETFEEANDFEIEDDDPEMRETVYEYQSMQAEVPREFQEGGSDREVAGSKVNGRSRGDRRDVEEEDEPEGSDGGVDGSNERGARGRGTHAERKRRRDSGDAARGEGGKRRAQGRVAPEDSEEPSEDDEEG